MSETKPSAVGVKTEDLGTGEFHWSGIFETREAAIADAMLYHAAASRIVPLYTLEAAREIIAMESPWRPIETAPKDGRRSWWAGPNTSGCAYDDHEVVRVDREVTSRPPTEAP